MKRLSEYFVIACFLLFLLGAAVVTLVREEETYSFFENRNLAAKPVYSVEADGNGSYFSGWEKYLSDHAAARNTLLRIKTKLDLFLGRPMVNDVVVTEDCLLPYLPEEEISREAVTQQAQALAQRLSVTRDAVESYGGIYCYVGVPCQYVYREEDYPWYLNNRETLSDWSTEALATAMAAQGVDYLDLRPVYEALGSPAELSSTVDNHYSIQGAFVAYQAILAHINEVSGLDISVLGEEDLRFETLPNQYLGSRTRKLLGEIGKDEKLSVAWPVEEISFTRTNEGQEVAATVYAMPGNEWQDVTYNLYMGGDIAETVIDTNREDLPSILIYGDSFTNAVECITYLSFDKMYSLDLRHYQDMTIEEYIAMTQPDVVVCIRDYESLLEIAFNGGGKLS